MPTGTTGQIQTSVAQQVNLVVAGGQHPDPEPGAVPDIQFWNGTTTVANGMVNGGSGLWTGKATNWTSADGARAAAWSNKFAVINTNPELVQLNGDVPNHRLQVHRDGWERQEERR